MYMNKVTAAVYNKAIGIKPPKNQVGKHKRLRNQLIESEYELDDLIQLIIKGHSFHPGRYRYSNERPAYEETYREMTFIETNLIVIDIDNGNLSEEDILNKSGEFVPSVIYATLSYTENERRYRVMYVMDRCLNREETIRVKTFFTKRLEGDEACMKTAAFMYFGGKSVILNEPVIVESEKILERHDVKEIVVKPISEISKKGSFRGKKGNSSTEKPEVHRNQIFERISHLVINSKPQSLYISDSFKFINSLDLSEILQVSESKLFRCIMPYHVDNNPSANIFNTEGKYMYKCHSVNCRANLALNSIDVLSILLDTDVLTMQEKILNILNIELTSPYKEMVKKTCEQNKVTIDELIEYHEFDNYSGRTMIATYKVLMDYVTEFVTPYVKEFESNDIIMTASQRHIKAFLNENGYGGDINRKLNRLTSLGLLNKKKVEELPDSKREQILKFQMDSQQHNHISIWQIPLISKSQIIHAAELEKRRKEQGYVLQGAGGIELAQRIGEEKASEIYNQQSIEVKCGTVYIVQRIMREKLNQKGWFLKQDIINEFLKDVKQSRIYKKYFNVARLGEGICAVPLNSEIRKKYNIPFDIKNRTHIYIRQ